MASMNHITLALTGLLFLASCAASPYRVEVKQDKDNSLNCQGLEAEIAQTEQYKTDSRAEDRFRFKYIMPLTAMTSIYNINKAESHAIKRIEYLQNIYQQKQCHLQPRTAHTSYPPAYPTTSNNPEDPQFGGYPTSPMPYGSNPTPSMPGSSGQAPMYDSTAYDDDSPYPLPYQGAPYQEQMQAPHNRRPVNAPMNPSMNEAMPNPYATPYAAPNNAYPMPSMPQTPAYQPTNTPPSPYGTPYGNGQSGMEPYNPPSAPNSPPPAWPSQMGKQPIMEDDAGIPPYPSPEDSLF